MSATWSRILAATWVLVAVAHGFVSVASRRTGKPLWWIDTTGVFGATTPAIGAAAVYLVMLGGFILAVRRSTRAPVISAALSFALGISAAADMGISPGAAVVALVVSAAGLLGSLACLAGRDPN
jgi:hypothetical protein